MGRRGSPSAGGECLWNMRASRVDFTGQQWRANDHATVDVAAVIPRGGRERDVNRDWTACCQESLRCHELRLSKNQAGTSCLAVRVSARSGLCEIERRKRKRGDTRGSRERFSAAQVLRRRILVVLQLEDFIALILEESLTVNDMSGHEYCVGANHALSGNGWVVNTIGLAGFVRNSEWHLKAWMGGGRGNMEEEGRLFATQRNLQEGTFLGGMLMGGDRCSAILVTEVPGSEWLTCLADGGERRYPKVEVVLVGRHYIKL
nr:hypothetical protein Iba_chr10bCG12220 [Ipomoea batatas]